MGDQISMERENTLNDMPVEPTFEKTFLINKETISKVPPSTKHVSSNSVSEYYDNLKVQKVDVDLSLLLMLVYKHKPYQIVPIGHYGVWWKVTNDYNIMLKNSNISYNELRSEFESLLAAYIYGKDLSNIDIKLGKLNQVVTEYKTCVQQKENAATSFLLHLVDQLKPHVGQYGACISKWEKVLHAYNSALKLNILNYNTLQKQFQQIVHSYFENPNRFYLECDNPSLLARLTEQYYNVNENFPKNWLNCLSFLVDKYKPFNEDCAKQDVIWIKILNDYNSLLNTKICDAFILQSSLEKAVNTYKKKKEFLINKVDIYLFDKIANKYTTFKVSDQYNVYDEININPMDVLLFLVNKYKPFLIPKVARARIGTWEHILSEFDAVVKMKYSSYITIQNKFKSIVDDYVYKNDVGGCTNIKLLDQLATQIVIENAALYPPSIVNKFKIQKENNLFDSDKKNISTNRASVKFPLISVQVFDNPLNRSVTKLLSEGKCSHRVKKRKIFKKPTPSIDTTAFSQGALMLRASAHL